MTHELKTPISTISLACEALMDKDFKKVGSRDKYLNIINDENKRLGGQVENVLSIAKTEKSNYRLELKELCVHEIIKDSVKRADSSKGWGSCSSEVKERIRTAVWPLETPD